MSNQERSGATVGRHLPPLATHVIARAACRLAALSLVVAVSLAGPASAQDAAIVQGLTREGRMERGDARELARRVHDHLIANARRGGGEYDPLRQHLGVALFGGPGRSRAEYNERLLQVIERLGEGLTQANLQALFAPSDEAPLRCAELFGVSMSQCDALIAAASRQRLDLPYMAPDPGTELQGDLTRGGVPAATATEIVRALSAAFLSVPGSLDRSPRGQGLERLMRACPGGLSHRDSQVRAWHVGPTSGLARCVGRAAGREGRRASSLLETALGISAEAAVPFLRWAHGQPMVEAPRGPSVEQLLAQATQHYRANRFADAARAYEQAALAEPTSLPAQQGLAVSRFRAGDARGAVDAYRAAARLSPRSAAIQVGLARALAQVGDRDGAVQAYRLALTLEPGRRDAASELAALAPPRAPAPPPPAAPSEAELRAQARAHFSARRFGEAERIYRQLAQMAPNDAGIHAGLGACLLGMGRAADAVTAYRRATELDGRNAGFVAALGGAFEAAGNVASARSAYQHALRLDPNQRGARDRLASLGAGAPPRGPAPTGPAIAAQTQPPPPAVNPALPPSPSREEIVRALAPLESRLEACAPTIDAVVVFRVRINGPTGVISEVEMIGQDATEEQGNCMEAHIRHARFPPFGQPEFEIRYPYALRGPNAPDERPPSVDAD